MVWIKRIVSILLLLLLISAATIGFITWRYADEIKAYALDALRSSIVTDISFNEEVVLSLWKDFPLIAVEISDIQIEDAFKTDTLLKVDKAFVQFDIIKIIQNQFTIEGIRVTDGFLRLRRNDHDKWNFRVWKEKEDDGAPSKTDFSIEILTLENIHLDYDDRMVDLNIQFLSEKSKLKGRFTDENTRLGLSIKGFMERLSTTGGDRIIDLSLSLAGVLNINSKESIYTIEMGNAILAGNEMVLDAEWTRIAEGTNMEMEVHAGNIEPFALLPHIWPQMPENIQKLKLEGRADLIFSLNGPFTKTRGPQLDATIRMRDGGLVFQETNVSELNFEGKLFMKDIKSSKAMEITFDSFDLRTPQGKVNGKGKLTDLSNPYLRLSSTGTSRLEEILTVAHVNEEMAGTGDVSWSIDFEGPLGPDFNTTVNELKQMRWSGSLNLSNTEMRFNANIPTIQNLNAKIQMQSGKTSIQDCSGKIGHLEFDGNVDIAQLTDILTDPNSKIALTGEIHIVELDIQQLPKEWHFESDSDAEKANSRPVSFKVKTAIDRIVYNNFSATSISGNLAMENELLLVNELHFKALDGNILTDLTYSPTSNGYVLGIASELRNIDMTRTLAEWDDFGQKGITSKNLKGRASAKLEAQIFMDKDFQILKDKLKVETDMEISGGELIKFEPLLALSKFISVDELNDVKFDTLRNQLSIHDGKLYIPKMSVSSSILNVQVFGEHGFDQEMDYHVNLLLNDLLRRKAKKKEMFDGHEIVDERGKTRLFLWVRGKPGDIKVGFDKKEVRQKLKEDFKQEGQTLKQLFKEEFGGASSTKSEPEAVQFQLEEEPTQPATKGAPEKEKTEQTDKPKKKKGFFSTEKEETETEGKFEIEFDP
ncbi:MAG: AsmA-like C-terminal region-containing protein [Flavobacteriales bacterium]|nr:AsmA-like C-terminal region-containing protein [Flavobacteriales bacterium]